LMLVAAIGAPFEKTAASLDRGPGGSAPLSPQFAQSWERFAAKRD
jgi:hypothetical protein